jgi:hypothetical protein
MRPTFASASLLLDMPQTTASKRKAAPRVPVSSPEPPTSRLSSRATTEEFDPFDPEVSLPVKRRKTSLEEFNERYDVENNTPERVLGELSFFLSFIFSFSPPSPAAPLCAGLTCLWEHP